MDFSKLKPIKCMNFKCKYAFADEYNWPECQQDIRGYIISFVERENRIICPYFEMREE